MISGAHIVRYTKDPEADRVFSERSSNLNQWMQAAAE